MVMTQSYNPNTTDGINSFTMKILKNRQYGPIGVTNLCKEIFLPTAGVFYAPYIPNFMTKPKYQFSRSNWYVVPLSNMDWKKTVECLEWCEETFGPQPKDPDAWSRWQVKYSSLHFRDAKDYEWFVLRWS